MGTSKKLCKSRVMLWDGKGSLMADLLCILTRSFVSSRFCPPLRLCLNMISIRVRRQLRVRRQFRLLRLVQCLHLMVSRVALSQKSIPMKSGALEVVGATPRVWVAMMARPRPALLALRPDIVSDRPHRPHHLLLWAFRAVCPILLARTAAWKVIRLEISRDHMAV